MNVNHVISIGRSGYGIEVEPLIRYLRCTYMLNKRSETVLAESSFSKCPPRDSSLCLSLLAERLRRWLGRLGVAVVSSSPVLDEG
jgi:hypothetical protein